MQEESPKTAARAAAEWWATQIGSPVFRIVGDRPGERDLGATFFEAFAGDRAARNPVTEEAAKRFADLLETAIADDLAADSERLAARARDRPDDPTYAPHVSIGVDYGPDRILADAADAAGVDDSRFPIKTNMSVYEDHVVGKVGYGSPRALVWSTPEWEQSRPECGAWRVTGYPDYDVHPGLSLCGLPRYHEGECGEWKPDPSVCGRCGKSRIAHSTKAAYGAGDRCRFEESLNDG
jgi:hypothetical protein